MERVHKANLTTLVLSGASTNGVVTIGAVQYLWDSEMHKDLVNFVGTSSGSMICGLLCVGYSPIDILAKLCTKDAYSSISPNLSSFIADGEGLYSFESIETILTEMFVEKAGRVPTIGELWTDFGKNFVCVTVNLDSKEKVYLTKETHSEVLVTDAVHMSSCFPIVFKPFKWKGQSYVDGGVGDNFPVVFSATYPGRGICISVNATYDDEHPRNGNLSRIVRYVYNVFTIHNNIIARDQDVVRDRRCFFLETGQSSFFDFSSPPMKLIEQFYKGYDELEKRISY